MFGFGKKLHAGMKLGKKEATYDPRTLRFATYKASLPAAPPSYDFSNRIHDLSVLQNNILGDCTAAGIAHLVQAWAAYNGVTYIPSDAATLALYEGSCGYNPADPSTDSGGTLIDVLKYVKANGFDGHEIDAYVAVNPKNLDEVKQALYYFGGLYVGVQLPLSAQDQTVWDVPFFGIRGKGEPGSWGGHAIANILDYDERGLTTITWGALKLMTWEFFQTYCDEAFCILSPDWYGPEKVAPTGFDSKALAQDLLILEAR
jgi:hypothetical protein